MQDAEQKQAAEQRTSATAADLRLEEQLLQPKQAAEQRTSAAAADLPLEEQLLQPKQAAEQRTPEPATAADLPLEEQLLQPNQAAEQRTSAAAADLRLEEQLLQPKEAAEQRTSAAAADLRLEEEPATKGTKQQPDQEEESDFCKSDVEPSPQRSHDGGDANLESAESCALRFPWTQTWAHVQIGVQIGLGFALRQNIACLRAQAAMISSSKRQS
jgi:hypothetical protein